MNIVSALIGPSRTTHEYTSFASQIDLVVDRHREAHVIYAITGSGSLSIEDGEGNTETVTLSAGGLPFIGMVRKILSSTSITRVRVGWP